MLRRDAKELTALLRLSQNDKLLYEGEIRPGHLIELPDGIRLEVLWIRKHTTPAPRR